jgi:hypothetical protein
MSSWSSFHHKRELASSCVNTISRTVSRIAPGTYTSAASHGRFSKALRLSGKV